MKCYKCYKAIEEGNLETLKGEQKNCPLYKGNQCHALPIEDSIGDKAMKATVSLFPQALKDKLPTLYLVLFLFAASITITIISIAYAHNNIAFGNNLTAPSDHRETIKAMTNREILQHYNYNPSHWLAVEILDRAEDVQWEELFSKTRDNPDLLIRLHGFITSLQTDFLFGSYITIGPNRKFSPTDVYINFDFTEASIGDEVIIFLIPVFGGNDTPLRSWEWTQIRNQ